MRPKFVGVQEKVRQKSDGSEEDFDLVTLVIIRNSQQKMLKMWNHSHQTSGWIIKGGCFLLNWLFSRQIQVDLDSFQNSKML